MLAREAKRKQRQIKHLEERADRARDELLSVWEAAQRNSFTASAQNKCVVRPVIVLNGTRIRKNRADANLDLARRFVTRAIELEKQVTTQTKRIEELEEMGTEAKREAAA